MRHLRSPSNTTPTCTHHDPVLDSCPFEFRSSWSEFPGPKSTSPNPPRFSFCIVLVLFYFMWSYHQSTRRSFCVRRCGTRNSRRPQLLAVFARRTIPPSTSASGRGAAEPSPAPPLNSLKNKSTPKNEYTILNSRFKVPSLRPFSFSPFVLKIRHVDTHVFNEEGIFWSVKFSDIWKSFLEGVSRTIFYFKRDYIFKFFQRLQICLCFPPKSSKNLWKCLGNYFPFFKDSDQKNLSRT